MNNIDDEDIMNNIDDEDIMNNIDDEDMFDIQDMIEPIIQSFLNDLEESKSSSVEYIDMILPRNLQADLTPAKYLALLIAGAIHDMSKEAKIDR